MTRQALYLLVLFLLLVSYASAENISTTSLTVADSSKNTTLTVQEPIPLKEPLANETSALTTTQEPLPTDATIRSQDKDQDGVLDSKDVCLETPTNTPIVNPYKNPTFAGCSCAQVKARIDVTNECIDFFCFEELLEINYEAKPRELVRCQEDYCEDYTYYDYPKEGYTACVKGELKPYLCTPKLYPNASLCGYEEQNETVSELIIPTTTEQPTKEKPLVEHQRYYLTDAEMNYTLPKEVREGEEANFTLTFSTNSSGLSFIPRLFTENGEELELLKPTCDDKNMTHVCTGTWALPTSTQGEQDLSLRIRYETDKGVAEENISLSLTVREQAFVADKATTPVVTGKDDEEETLVRAIFVEYIEEDAPQITSVDDFIEKLQETSRFVQTEKNSSYDPQTNTTTIRVHIRPKTGMLVQNITIIEFIPKEVAQTVADISFSIDPIVLNDDPLVMWQFATVNEDLDLSYELEGEAQITGNTVVVAENIENEDSPWLIIVPMLIIPVIVILLIFVPRILKKKKRV